MVKINSTFLGLLFASVLSACGGSNDSQKNEMPSAQISLDKATMDLNDSVTVSGESSSDPDGDALTYQWSIKTESGDEYTLAKNTERTFVFTPENIGIHHISLVVSDAKSNSKVVTSSLIVNPNAEDYPIAIISDDLQSKVGKVNWLSAELSTSADGQLLSYFWELKSSPSASNSVIADDSKINAYFIADVVGSYEVSLTVTNQENQLTDSKVLKVEVSEVLANSPPVATISEAMATYSSNQVIKFNASASYDSDGDGLEYNWTLVSPSQVQHIVLIGKNTEFVEFEVDEIGEYQIVLTVSDGQLAHEVSHMFTATNQNLAPLANAGPDHVTVLGIPLMLDGSGSLDADGSTSDLTYQWSLISRPVTSSYDGLSNSSFSSESQFSFSADVMGEYLIGLQVFDGVDYSAVDHIYIEVTDNQKPVAILDNDIVVNASANLEVNSTESFDPEGAALTYMWHLINTPEDSVAELISLENLSTAILSFDMPGTYTIQLIVNDGTQDSSPATLNVVYTPEELSELTVSGQLIDEAGLPLAISAIGGILQQKSASDENGEFEVLLKSRNKDAALTVLTISDKTILSTILRIPETDETQLDLGQVKVPVLQRKDISLAACDGYSGAEKVTVYFSLAIDGYQNMKFIKPVVAELTVGETAQSVKLPAKGLLKMRLSTANTSGIYTDDGEDFFIHQYQADDTQTDPLMLTICN